MQASHKQFGRRFGRIMLVAANVVLSPPPKVEMSKPATHLYLRLAAQQGAGELTSFELHPSRCFPLLIL